MGGLFRAPTPEVVAPPPPPEPAPSPAPQAEPAAAAAESRIQSRARSVQAATLATSPRGVLSAVPVTRKSLLGE